MIGHRSGRCHIPGRPRSPGARRRGRRARDRGRRPRPSGRAAAMTSMLGPSSCCARSMVSSATSAAARVSIPPDVDQRGVARYQHHVAVRAALDAGRRTVEHWVRASLQPSGPGQHEGVGGAGAEDDRDVFFGGSPAPARAADWLRRPVSVQMHFSDTQKASAWLIRTGRPSLGEGHRLLGDGVVIRRTRPPWPEPTTTSAASEPAARHSLRCRGAHG